MTVISELVEFLTGAAKVDHKREISIETKRGTYLYNDGEKHYSRLIPEYKRKLSNVESLAVVVTEEAKRRNIDNGQFMTVIFTESGGVFFPDDERRLDEWHFDRCLSQQWEYLAKHLNRPMFHKQFLRFMQGLRPSLGYHYSTLMRDYRKVTFDNNTSVKSQPILESGTAGVLVNMTLSTRAGDQEIEMPGGFEINLQFAKAGEKIYTLPVELDVALEDGKPEFMLVCPTLDSVRDQAIQDEVAFFREATANLPELLILVDY
jgi:hypothetical protein